MFYFYAVSFGLKKAAAWTCNNWKHIPKFRLKTKRSNNLSKFAIGFQFIVERPLYY